MNQTAEQISNSPSFEQIIPAGTVLEAVKALGFQAPTDVQAAAIPAALKGQDLIVQARTGSGKTFAFVIPILVRLQQAAQSGQIQRGTLALIVTPSRELANQIEQVIASITSDIKPACLIGGASIGAQINALQEDPRIVVGTPGRILDMIRQRHLLLRKCQMFVLDEADEMLSEGFMEDVRAILSRLPDRRQGLFVSATITPRVNVLAGSFLSKPETIRIGKPGEDLPPIEHLYYEVGDGVTTKASALCDLIEIMRPRSAMIFCNTKSDTETVEIFLRRRGYDARRLNSDLSQKERSYIMERIKSQELRFLVGTDLASRGIDIEEMDLVINYAIPDEPDSYLHRTGRTGRAGRSGTAISLVGPQDFMAFLALKRHITFELKKLPLPGDEEVIQARLAHFYELLRQSHIEPQERDLLLARKLLRELGGIEEPGEEITEALSRLCRFAIEHSIKLETCTLEEEMRRHAAQDHAGRDNSISDDKGKQFSRRSPDRGRGRRDPRRHNARRGRR